MTAVVIPAYEPDNELIKLVEGLNKEGFSILVVNDGSSNSCDDIFNSISHKAKVIKSEKNEGKGAALKKGFKTLREVYPECKNFITADADGQHKIEDIIRVREALEDGKDFVLTVRHLQGNIPFRSKFGNDLSRIVYTVMNGHYFDDNQSGLRGFHIKHLDWLTLVKGDKYDYEMNMLVFADKQGIKISTVPIRAVYIDGNASSHFNPVLDTVRIYKRLFLSTWPSIFSIALWEILTLFITIFLSYEDATVTVPCAVMLATVISVFLQRFTVFRKMPYKDGFRTLLFGAIRSTAYTGVLRLVAVFTEAIPIIIVINVAALVVLIVEYQIHKIMHKIL